MAFLHCFTYYILNKYKHIWKTEKFFLRKIVFHEQSLCVILCSEFIHHFLENFKFYSSVHVTLGVVIKREGVFFGVRRKKFSKANKHFQLKKRDPQNLSDVQHARRDQPKRAETTQRNYETTQNDSKFQNWENLEFSSSIRFSNFKPKCPNLAVLFQKY